MSEKKYNTSMIGLYKKKSGNYMSLTLDIRNIDQIMSALKDLKVGGKIMLRHLTDEHKAKFRNPKGAPDAFIDIISPESVAEYETQLAKRAQGVDYLG